MFQRILVATDLGELSERAIDLAVELAKKAAARLTLVHVCEVPSYTYAAMGYDRTVDLLGPLQKAARSKLDARMATLRQDMPGAEAILRMGVPSEEILAAIVDTKADLVVMATRGRRGVGHALLGSVAEKIVRLSPTPVLTVRAAATRRRGAARRAAKRSAPRRAATKGAKTPSRRRRPRGRSAR